MIVCAVFKFKENPEATDGASAESLSKRLFKARLELVGTLDKRGPIQTVKPDVIAPDAELRQETAERLGTEVAAMNLEAGPGV